MGLLLRRLLYLMLFLVSIYSVVDRLFVLPMTIKDAKVEAGKDIVAIPAGCFQMGSTNDGENDEKPVHRVCLSAFTMDKYEVTRGAFTASQGRNPHENDGTCMVWVGSSWREGTLSDGFMGVDQPQVCVDWNQAQAYCESQGKRLPSEAEFDYANRAGSTTEWQCGNDDSCLTRIAWYNAENNSQTHPVGQKQPNAWGLYDMTGNVWEWTNDWYGNDYYGQSPSQDPRGPASGSDRVIRGGGWYDSPTNLRLALRNGHASSSRNHYLGFRCAL